MAEKHSKPWIHVDASKFSVDDAVEVLRAWVSGNKIKVLNVVQQTTPRNTGERHSLLLTFLDK